jgi:hypothetical protein
MGSAFFLGKMKAISYNIAVVVLQFGALRLGAFLKVGEVR